MPMEKKKLGGGIRNNGNRASFSILTGSPQQPEWEAEQGGEGDWPFYRRKITQVAFRASPSSSCSQQQQQQQQQQHQMGRISGPAWIRRIFPPMIHSRTLTFDESTRVSADVTAVRAMRNGSGDPSSCFRLLSRLIRLQSWELRSWPHTETYKRPALCAASSATQRQRTAERSASWARAGTEMPCAATYYTLRMCARTLVKGALLLLLLLLWIMILKIERRSNKTHGLKWI